jgi:hypothetical protein
LLVFDDIVDLARVHLAEFADRVDRVARGQGLQKNVRRRLRAARRLQSSLDKRHAAERGGQAFADEAAELLHDLLLEFEIHHLH